jgi:heme a synthase
VNQLPTEERRRRFVGLVTATLAWNVVVILWGAFVRATGSGAGCGAHWPLCNGEVVPQSPRIETWIELSHRLSSGVALILGLSLLIVAVRWLERGHLARRAAFWSFVFLLGEAAIGAGLVLFELVADNESTARALSMAAHLTNTCFLLAALTTTLAAARERDGFANGWLRVEGEREGRAATGLWLLGGLVLASLTGAIAALGDTLYPSTSLGAALRLDIAASTALLLKLRTLHPFVAVGAGLFAWAFAARGEGSVARRAIAALVPLQIVAGVVNVALLAPIWMQIGHLLIADSLWIAAVAMVFATRWRPAAPGGTTP